MSDDQQQPEVQQAPTPTPTPLYPIALTAQEVQAILNMVRKFPMEQVEGLVHNIVTQFNNIHATLQPKE